MARASLSYKSGKKAVVANKGAAAVGNRYAAQAKAAVSYLNKGQAANAARLSMQARKPPEPPKQVVPKNLSQVAQAMAKNQPKPVAAKPLQAPAWLQGGKGGGGIMQNAQNLQRNFVPERADYQVPSGSNIMQNAQNLRRNFVPERGPVSTTQPKPYQDEGFNKYAPPTKTVLPDTYQGQVDRIIERAMASGRTLPDTIQGMLDRLGQQYYQPPTASPWQRTLPDTLESMIERLIESANSSTLPPTDSAPYESAPYEGAPYESAPYEGYSQQPGIADIMRWLYGSIYWRGW